MSTVWPLICGLAVTVLLGFGVRPLLDAAVKSTPLLPPGEASEKRKAQWLELMKGTEGGVTLGWLERFIFFAAFVSKAEIAVAAWLAFKVASKWNAWTNVIAVPDKIVDLDDLDFLIARRRWGSHVLMTFLIGTAYNIIAGMLGAAVVLHWSEIITALSL